MKRTYTSGLVMLAFIVAVSSARATILNFDLNNTFVSGDPIPQAYGDFVSGGGPDGVADSYDVSNGTTPNISLSYAALHDSGQSTPTGFRYWNDAEWPEVAYLFTHPADDVPSLRLFELTFTPDAGYGVLINSFLLDDYASYMVGIPHTVDWSVRAGLTVLLSGTASVPSAGATSVTTGMSAPHFGTLTLRLHHSAGDREDLALDNVSFNQIPEPSVALLTALGGLMLCVRRRRRS